MLKNFFDFVKSFAEMYTKNSIPRAAAALSYYLTMTIFPLIICLYTLLGSNYASALDFLGFAEDFISADTVLVLEDFFDYVSNNSSPAMLAAGLAVLVTSASAAIRNIQGTIGNMQGGTRFQGLLDFIFSIIFSLIFLAAMYFSVLVIVTSREILVIISGVVPFIDVNSSWIWLRFLLLAGIFVVIFCGVYQVSKRRTDKYKSLPGAALATVAMVIMSYIFSIFISTSAKYPLVYGSLASLILLMFWLYLCCQILFAGAVFNICLRDRREDKKEEK